MPYRKTVIFYHYDVPHTHFFQFPFPVCVPFFDLPEPIFPKNRPVMDWSVIGNSYVLIWQINVNFIVLDQSPHTLFDHIPTFLEKGSKILLAF